MPHRGLQRKRVSMDVERDTAATESAIDVATWLRLEVRRDGVILAMHVMTSGSRF